MRKLTNTKSKVKAVTTKHCAFLDKSCIGDECAQYYKMFDKCTFELLTYNMHPLTVALTNLNATIQEQ